MTFEQAHAEFLDFHASRRKGERLRRLREGHGHAEKRFLERVWWPAYGHFRHLHPEYEIADFHDGSRFLDFAFLRGGIKLAIEVDGYGPHVRNLSRRQFANQLERQNHLVLDGWSVLRFSYDKIDERPRQCQQTIQQFMGRWFDEDEVPALNFKERAVIRLARTLERPFTPKEVRSHLQIGRNQVYELLRGLVRRGWLDTAHGRKRIRAYALRHTRWSK